MRSSKTQMPNNLIGKLLAVFQLVVSFIFVVIIWNSNMVPAKYLIVLGMILLLLFGLAFGLQYIKNKAHILGSIVSVLVSLSLVIGAVYFGKADSAIKNVGGATYKTDNMIVVVKSGNPAESLLDAKNYRFGSQTSVDQENTNLMTEKVNQVLGREVHMTTFETIQEEAQALIDGRIEAAIYNEGFAGLIEDTIENYDSQVRILYQYGIDTQLETVDAPVSQGFSVYISGIDVSGPITTNSRSDVNIIATVNPDTRQILLTTTPRDYYVTIQNISGEQRDKLTHAGIYGVDTSMATLEQIYDTNIDYYARVNFTSLIKIVDVLGGIDVNSDYAFTSLYGGYTFAEGMNHMNGDQALGFCRERYSFETGDNQRGKNQEAVLTAIIKKMMSPAILTNATNIIASVSDSVETNMGQQQMSELIRMQLESGGDWNVLTTNAIGAGDTQMCYSSGSEMLYVMWPNEDSVAQISDKMKRVLNGDVIS